MRPTLLYWTLLGIGGLASLALVPLAVPAGRVLDLIGDGDAIPAVTFYLAGAFVYLKRPDHAVARWLLVTGTGLTTALALASALSWIIDLGLPAPWLWVGNALEQMCEIIAFSALVAAFALFPDGSTIVRTSAGRYGPASSWYR
jgi:hypothetical protein